MFGAINVGIIIPPTPPEIEYGVNCGYCAPDKTPKYAFVNIIGAVCHGEICCPFGEIYRKCYLSMNFSAVCTQNEEYPCIWNGIAEANGYYQAYLDSGCTNPFDPPVFYPAPPISVQKINNNEIEVGGGLFLSHARGTVTSGCLNAITEHQESSGCCPGGGHAEVSEMLPGHPC